LDRLKPESLFEPIQQHRRNGLRALPQDGLEFTPGDIAYNDGQWILPCDQALLALSADNGY
jgi:hypothetical protein